ncbi:MAG: hypothetical protein AB7I50_02230 [Vicinamibacterales bacterium]
MLELVGLVVLLAALAVAALLVGLVATLLKLVVWVVVLPLRLIGTLLWLPLLAIGTLAGGLVIAAVLVLPLLPFVLVAGLAWMLVKRSRRPSVA